MASMGQDHDCGQVRVEELKTWLWRNSTPCLVTHKPNWLNFNFNFSLYTAPIHDKSNFQVYIVSSWQYLQRPNRHNKPKLQMLTIKPAYVYLSTYFVTKETVKGRTVNKRLISLSVDSVDINEINYNHMLVDNDLVQTKETKVNT